MDNVPSKKLSLRERQIIQRFKNRLNEITPVTKIVVFGSRARGTADPDSDLDLYIELPELDADLRGEIRQIAWEISLEEGMVISTFVVTTSAVVESPLGANPILQTIEREGIAV